MEKWNSQDIRQMKQFEGIKSRGYYVNGIILTDLYNKIFNTNLKPTNCASCLNLRFNDLERSLRIFERALAEEEEQKAKEEAIVEENKPKRGRPKKGE